MANLDKTNLNVSNDLEDEISLIELFQALKEGKRILFFITSLFAVCSIIYSLTLTNLYRSQSLLIAEDSKDLGSLSQYSGMASLVGLNIGGAGTDGSIEVMEIIKSREFVKHLITFDDVLPSIMAAKSFDIASKELSFDFEIYNPETKTWAKKPSYLEVYKVYLDGIMSISQDEFSGLISINVEHMSPIFAKDFLDLIIKEANNLKRDKDISTSTNALNYLKLELSNTKLVEIKDYLLNLV